MKDSVQFLANNTDSKLKEISKKIRLKRRLYGNNIYIKQEPITRSVIVRYILPSPQSQKCLFFDPDFPQKAVTMMTATKAKTIGTAHDLLE